LHKPKSASELLSSGKGISSNAFRNLIARDGEKRRDFRTNQLAADGGRHNHAPGLRGLTRSILR
jgi:hypothetical protein